MTKLTVLRTKCVYLPKASGIEWGFDIKITQINGEFWNPVNTLLFFPARKN